MPDTLLVQAVSRAPTAQEGPPSRHAASLLSAHPLCLCLGRYCSHHSRLVSSLPMTQPTVRPSLLSKPVQSAQTSPLQQHFEGVYPAGNMQSWQTNGVSRSLNSYAGSPSTGAQVSAAAAPFSPYSTDFSCSTLMNSYAFGNNNSLPMIPATTATGTVYPGHVQDAADFLNNAERHPTMIKAENQSPDERLWRYQMPQSNIQHQQSAVRTELSGVMSPTSPMNSFSGGQLSRYMTLPSRSMVKEINTDFAW